MTTKDRWTPPGYYVNATSHEGGACGHCGVVEEGHSGVLRYCPKPPLFTIREDNR